MSVYEQLKAWQKIPHAQAEWKKYRENLTDFIIEHTKASATVVILGAGACHDLNLSRLSRHFVKITLLDKELASLQEACQYYQVGKFATASSASCEVEITSRDLLGISEDAYEDFSNALQNAILLRGKHTDIRELARLAEQKAAYLYQKAFSKPLDLQDLACDYVIAAGLHSQLNNMLPFIWSAYEQALEQRYGEIYSFFEQHNTLAVKRLDNAILSMAECGLVFALERTRLGIPGSVQGAVQGLSDLEEAVKQGLLYQAAETTLYWNFDLAQAIAYEMLVLYMKRKERLC